MLSKKFETLHIRSNSSFSNIENIRSEHIQTLNFSIQSDLIRTANINVPDQHGINKKLDIYNIFLIATEKVQCQ